MLGQANMRGQTNPMLPIIGMPPPLAERPRKSDGQPADYEAQKRIIVQILIDRVTRFDKATTPYDPDRPDRPIPAGEVSDGHSHLTAEGLSNSPEAQSRRLVEDALERMATLTPHLVNPILEFFHVDASHSDYRRLSEKAEADAKALAAALKSRTKAGHSAKALVQYAEANQTPAMQTYARLSTALDVLVMNLLDFELTVRFPELTTKMTNRKRTMIEHYKEIYRVWSDWCSVLKLQHTKYRNKAFDRTAIACNVDKSTVQRAVKYIETNNQKAVA